MCIFYVSDFQALDDAYLCFTMNNWNMNRSIRIIYIGRLLLLLNASCIFYIHFKCILCPNEISELSVLNV